MMANKKGTRRFLIFVMTTFWVVYSSAAISDTIHVPADFTHIQMAIDAAVDGDVVLVAPGVYKENLLLSGKSIVLASRFHTTGKKKYIDATVIDGGGAEHAILVKGAGANAAPTIVGFTIRNANDGVKGHRRFTFLNNRVTDTKDGIDYESGSGGLVRSSVFENNRDDGIDLDGAVEVIIEQSLITNNKDDGIEIRLHDYVGRELEIVIRDNEISSNGEDGIQLIDDDKLSSRVFHIERNLILKNKFSGVGMMCCMDTVEDFQGANIREPITLLNNTFAGNNYGVTGGDNVVVLNNLFIDTANIALKGVDSQSIAAFNLCFGNGQDFSSSNIDLTTTLFEDPLVDANHEITPSSPAVDFGTAYFEHNGGVVLDLVSDNFKGAGPDIGHVEIGRSSPAEPIALPKPPSAVPTVEGETKRISIPILASEDDAEEDGIGDLVMASTDLDLSRVWVDQTVGMRFNGLGIPKDAKIVNAYIQFTAIDNNSKVTQLSIEAENTDNAATFNRREKFNISSRQRTQAAISWSPASWTPGKQGPDQQTPDLRSIIQEVVSRPGWISGNSVAIIITGKGVREAQSFDYNPANAAVLHLEFQ